MWWEGQGKRSLAIPLEHLLSRSREPARRKRAVCAHCTVIVKNNLNSTAIVSSPLKWVENFKLLGQSRVYIMACVRNTFSFVQTPNVRLSFSSSLLLQPVEMVNTFTSVLKSINWVGAAVSRRWNQHEMKAMK